MIDNLKISIIIPCYNEEEGLKNILESMPHFIDQIIVVDNGSKDNTIHIAKSYNANLVIEKVRGYGRTIRKGLDYVDADTDIIGIIDGDASYPIKFFQQMVIYMKNSNFDFVSGCRFPLTNFKAMPFINILANYFISWLIRFLFKIDIIDSQSGMVVFKKHILHNICVSHTGMGFSQEIKIKNWLDPNMNCSEFHIPYYPRIGKVKFNKMKDSLKNLYDAVVLWRKFKNNIH